MERRADGRRAFACQIGLIAAFVVASVFNALTDGFTVMLVVPLVDTLASNSLFASIPLLGQFGALFEGLTVSQRLQWIALILGVIVLARGAIQYFLDIIVYVIPTEIEKELQARCLRRSWRRKRMRSTSIRSAT